MGYMAKCSIILEYSVENAYKEIQASFKALLTNLEK